MRVLPSHAIKCGRINNHWYASRDAEPGVIFIGRTPYEALGKMLVHLNRATPSAIICTTHGDRRHFLIPTSENLRAKDLKALEMERREELSQAPVSPVFR